MPVMGAGVAALVKNNATNQIFVGTQTAFTTTGLTKQVAVTPIVTVDAVVVSFASAQGIGATDEQIWCAKTQSTGGKITPTRRGGTPATGAAFSVMVIGH